MKRRRHRRRLPSDEFLRALRERADRRLPERAGSEDTRPRGVDGGPPDRRQDPVRSPEPKADPNGETDELARRAVEAERLLAQARDEAERRLTDAQAAIEQEREARLAAERRVKTERVAREAAERARVEREAAEREATEREAAAGEQAERDAAEGERAEREAAQQRPANGSQAQPAAPARRPRAWLGLGRRSRRRVICTTCGRQHDGSVSDAAASGWEIHRKGRALCDRCLSEGWHLPDGALLPMRRSGEADASETPHR